MDTNFANFQAWFSEILKKLYPDEDGGIAVLMVSMPLLERYLRNKLGYTPDDPLDGPWYNGLCEIFPALTSGEIAKRFWGVFRNGFLHQGTLSLKRRGGVDLPAGELTHQSSVSIKVNGDGSFVLQPILFSQHVIARIEADFATYVGAGTASPPLAQVITRGSNAVTIDAGTQQHTYLGTGNRP